MDTEVKYWCAAKDSLIQRSETKGSKFGYVFCKGYNDDAWWDPLEVGNCTTNLEEIPWNETGKRSKFKKKNPIVKSIYFMLCIERNNLVSSLNLSTVESRSYC